MIDTHPFSHNIIYDQLKDFFLSHGVEKKKFKYESPNLIYQDTVYCSKSGKDLCVFGIDYSHRLWKEFSSHLNDSFHFSSQLGKLIKHYNDLFKPLEKSYYNIYHHYFVTVSGQIEKLYIFDFENINDNCLFLVETKDSDINLFEQEILEYYINSFTKEFPKDLIKPLSMMTEDERNLVHMICI